MSLITFYCSDKYENIITCLEKRGWKNIAGEHDENLEIPTTCSLVWRNLSDIHFQTLFGRYVNHIKGIYHLSNKVFLLSC
jgi:hypothetical protein